MSINPTEEDHQAVRKSLLNSQAAKNPARLREYAGRAVAALYRCQECSLWWISGAPNVPEVALILDLAEPNSQTYLWQDFYGWQQAAHTCCANCGQKIGEPECELHVDEEGQLILPDAGQFDRKNEIRDNGAAQEDGNPFSAYISQSKHIAENMFVIAAWEARQELNAWGYTADINDVREQMDEMRSAFKDAVYGYAALLPPGWRVMGDYDKWVKGQACAGFLHGEINPDASLMIGGGCSTVADLEMQLDRLFRLVSEMSC